MNRSDVLIVDTETTGVDPTVDEVVDIAVIDTVGQSFLDEMVMPTVEISADASRVHGLTTEILAEMQAKDWSEHHDSVCQLLQRAAVVLSYNAAFDEEVITRTAQIHALSVPRGIPWRCPMLDYSEWVGEPDPNRLGEAKWFKLEDAYKRAVGNLIHNV